VRRSIGSLAGSGRSLCQLYRLAVQLRVQQGDEIVDMGTEKGLLPNAHPGGDRRKQRRRAQASQSRTSLRVEGRLRDNGDPGRGSDVGYDQVGRAQRMGDVGSKPASLKA